MSNFLLSTDSCCDEFKSVLEQENIKYIPMSFICEDEIFQDKSNSVKDFEDFYSQMRNGKIFSTTGLNSIEVKEYFESLLKEFNQDIVHICLSSGLSGTYNIVQNVANEINETSNKKVYVFDSLSATQPQNALVCMAKIMRDAGLNAVETITKLQDNVQHLLVYFILNDLDALRRGGRISGLQAVMGKALQLRPLLTFDSEGKLKVIEKVIGTKKAINTLFKKFDELHDKNSDFPTYLASAGENYVEDLKNLILEKYPNTKFKEGQVGPVIASHTGPALTGIIFVSEQKRI